MLFREVPSLSRLLDTKLEVEVVPGSVTNLTNMLNITVSIPTEDFVILTGDEIENLYLRPMVKAIAKKLNTLGNVKAGSLPLPKKEIAFNCTNGKIPVLLRVVRRYNPDRHQILIHVLVQPEDENGS